MQDIVSVVLCGGEGRRLAPFSTSSTPKQFIPLSQAGSLFQQTMTRCSQLSEHTVIVTLGKLLDTIINQAHPSSIEAILEPSAKNTAPAIAMAALYIMKKYPDSIMCVMPSDHVIEKEHMLEAAIKTALPDARNGKIVTFGIKPEIASEQFGYIITEGDNLKVKDFIEKPNKKLAQDLISKKGCFWNSGIFLFKPETIITEMKRYLPEFFAIILKSFYAGTVDGGNFMPDEETFNSLLPVQIDKAVLQKTDRLVVKPVDIGWMDLGSIELFYQYYRKNSSAIPFLYKFSNKLYFNNQKLNGNLL